MTDKQFVNGMSIKTYKGQYGEILNCGINLKKIQDNPLNGDWVNFSIKKGKSGNWYAEITEKPNNSAGLTFKIGDEEYSF